jgi:hypothetical protein
MSDPYRSSGLWYTGRDVEEQESVIREVTHREPITIRGEIYRVRRGRLEIGEFTALEQTSQ